MVNLAARLMSKAKGCVYIDEKTYFYLSNDAQQRLTSLEPILVKGKSVPISIYSYTSSELLFLQSGEVYDSHLRVITKNILMSHIQSMIMKESTISPSTRTAKPITRKGSSDTTAMPATSENYKYYYSSKDAVTQSLVKPPMKFVLLEGKVGSGKASALKWFRLQAEKEDLRIISVGLTPKDSFIEYKAISRLFRALIGEESFDNIQTQKSFVLHVLNELYPNDKDTAENVAFPAMRIALGITCTIKSNANYKQYNGNSYYNGNNSNNQEVSNRSCKVQRLPPRLIMETLHRLFEYLLNMETSGTTWSTATGFLPVSTALLYIW